MNLTQEKISADVIELQRRLVAASRKGQIDKQGAFNGTSKIAGYVCKIHGDDDPDEELRGTVDVQEYAYRAEDYNGDAAGFHEGVLISAVQGNQGYKIVPCMFSEVIIMQDPSTLQWYVTMYSHATIIDLKAHDEVNIEVTEYEPFEESDDGLSKDYDELEETGNKSSVNHTATSINTAVTINGEGLLQEVTAEHKTIEVGDTKIVIDGQNVTIETSGQVQFKVGDTTITEEDGKVSVKSDDVNVECSTCKIKADTTDVDGGTVNVKGDVTIKGGSLKTQGTSNTDLNGPYNAIKVCPFSGAPHCGSSVSGT